jgi:Concanavalin A-like lectin/glucanases superfamily/Domain of unknown function (DUF2341)
MRRSFSFLVLSSLCVVAPACLNLSTTDPSGAGGTGGEWAASSGSTSSGGNSSSSSSSSGGGGSGGGANPSPLPGWTFRRPVIIDAQDEALDEFVLLVSVAKDSMFGMNVQPDGDDLVFTDSDGVTILPHELEYFNTDSGVTFFRAWVRVPLIPTLGKTLYVYYGNSVIGSQQNKGGTWQDFRAVYHMENGFLDASSNARHGSPVTMLGPAPVPDLGKIGSALKFLGGSYGEVPHSPDFNCITNPCSISMWINSAGQSSHVVDHYFNGDGWNLGTEGGLMSYTHGASMPIQVATVMSNNEWHHVALIKDLSAVTMYLDGVQVQSKFFGGGLTNSSSPLYIGTGNPDSNFFVGLLDEVRISSASRKTKWIQAEVGNVLQGVDFVVLGAPEQFF